MALEAAGASLDDVVRLGIYVKNLRHEDGAVIRKALRRLSVRDTLPTSTWLGVTSLALDELLAEVEANAVIEQTTRLSRSKRNPTQPWSRRRYAHRGRSRGGA